MHYIRDATLGEDASRVRKGAAPEVMAVLRNVTLGLLRLNGVKNVARGAAADQMADRASPAPHRTGVSLRAERP